MGVRKCEAGCSGNTKESEEITMIITRTPFRVSFCGGGSDLAEFYEQREGCVLSTSINKYMYISIHPYFDEHMTALKYSKTEIVDDLDKIEHKIFRTVLGEHKLDGVEITSTADIPSGTGLGSSSTFTVGLLNAVNVYKGKYVSKGDLAQKACEIEIERLGAPIGKQDQYAAAFGGFNFIRFLPNGDTAVEPVLCKKKVLRKLQDNLIMLYTGDVRNANTILAEQSKNMSNLSKVDGLVRMCNLARDMRDAIQTEDLSSFGDILNDNWKIKRELASGISNLTIDSLYEKALAHGAVGGKLLGAGGGGFLLFYCKEGCRDQVKESLGLRELPFEFEHSGSSTIFVGDKYWD